MGTPPGIPDYSTHDVPSLVSHMIAALDRDGDFEVAEAARLANRVYRASDARCLVIEAHEPDYSLLTANHAVLAQHLGRIDCADWTVIVMPANQEIAALVQKVNKALTLQGLPTVLDIKVRARDSSSQHNVAVIPDDTPGELAEAIDGVLFSEGTRHTAISRVPTRRTTLEQPPPPKQRQIVFISYGKDDKEYVDDLVVHLGRLRHEGVLAWEFNAQLDSGDEHDPQIKDALARADAAIVVVSQHWFASDYIHNVESPALMESNIPVYPLFARTCDWTEHEIAKKWAGTGTTPLEQLDTSDRNAVYTKLAQDLRERFS
jgi:hypothetical protein